MKEEKNQVQQDSKQVLLEQASQQLLSVVKEAEQELESSYQSLAKEAVDREGNSKFDQQIQSKIDSLHQVNNNLKQAHQQTITMEDELSARFRDMQKSRDRKWYRLNPPANATIDLEEKRRSHFAQGINAYKLMLVCFVGSFAGVVVESIWCVLRHGYLESRAGLVYGPFNLLYGVGAVTLTLALYRFRNRGRWLSFLGGMLVGSVVEYICSWGQELVLGSRSWDYSKMPFNLNGRICLLYSCFWGLLGVLWIKDIYPRMAKWILKLPNRAGKICTWCATIFLVINCVVSMVAVWRWAERVHEVPASGSFWEMVDEHFPDERMEKVYANMQFGK
jgi:uncharacterized membrane protein